jgi:hypothetical protein
MRALTNPYTPNAGAEPQAVVGRDDQLAWFDLLLARVQRGRTEQSGANGTEGIRCCRGHGPHVDQLGADAG